MVKDTHTLRWPDEASVTATASATTPEDSVPVTWSGHVERVPPARRLAVANLRLLSMIFRNLSLESGAEWSWNSEGEYGTPPE